ncbi:Unknown protein, partial [Striga hermonthica]
QKARALWLKEEDRNSKFFYAYVAQRRKMNSIDRLLTGEGSITQNPAHIETTIIEFYEQLSSSKGCQNGQELLLCIQPSITREMNDILIAPVEDDTIKKAIFSIHPDKSPGEDGMTGLFYQHFWPIIGPDICTAVKSFFDSGQML